MTLLAPIVAGIAVALLRRGSLRRLADLRIRLGWLAVLCLMVQFWLVYQPMDRIEADRNLHAAILMASYTVLATVVWANRRVGGMAAVGVGLLLNLSVMAANGGFMPVSPEAVLAAKLRPPESLDAAGSRLPRSKDILLTAEQTRLWLLSDVIVVPAAPGTRIYSIGDLVVGLGIFLVVHGAMVPRRGERVLERKGVNAS